MELPLGSRVGEHGPYAVSTPGGIFNIPSERVVRDYGHCIPIRKDQLKRLQKIGILENFCGASAWLLWKVRSMWIVVVRVPFQYLANADARASFSTRASNSPENDVCIWCVRFDIKMEERAPWAPSGQRPVGSTFLWPLTPPQAVSVYEKFKLDPKEQGSRLLTDYAPPPTGTSIYNNSVDFARFATERSAAFHPIRGLDEFSSSSVTTQVLLAALRPAVYPVSNNLGENGTNREHDEYEILGNGVVVFNNLVPFLKLPVALTGANVPCGVVPAVLRRRFKHSPAILDVLPDDIVDKIVGGLARACVRNAHKSSHKLWLSLRGVSKSFKERADFAACEFVNRTDELYTDLGSAQVNNQNRQGQGQGQGQGQSQSQRLAARKAAETRILRLGLHVQKSRVNLFRMISELEAATAATATTATATTAVATNSAPKQRLLARDCLLIYMRVRGGQGGDPPGRPAQVPSKAKTTWSWTPPRPNPTTKLLHTINLASESRTNHSTISTRSTRKFDGAFPNDLQITIKMDVPKSHVAFIQRHIEKANFSRSSKWTWGLGLRPSQ